MSIGTQGSAVNADVAAVLPSPGSPGVVRTRCRWARLAHPGRRTTRAVPVAPLAPGSMEPGVAFPQRAGGMDWLLGSAVAALPQDDDAFQVSIAAPPGVQRAPLLVFFPGGAFVSGAGAAPWYEPGELAAATGAVVMVMGYRLGAFGALGRGKDGTPLLVDDVLRATRWALDHAEHFGADPEQLTLAGHSAGAWAALVVAQDPALAPLVRRLALYSLPYQPPPGPAGRKSRQEVVETALAGRAPDELSREESVEVSATLSAAWAGRGLGVQPPAGGRLPLDLQDLPAVVSRLRAPEVLLTDTLHEARAMVPPMVAGSVSETSADGYEAAHFGEVTSAGEALGDVSVSGWERLTAAMTEFEFAGFARELGDELASSGITVHRSRWDVECAVPGAGAAHNSDLPALFGADNFAGAPMLGEREPEGWAEICHRFRAPLVDALAGRMPSTAAGTLRSVGVDSDRIVQDPRPFRSARRVLQE